MKALRTLTCISLLLCGLVGAANLSDLRTWTFRADGKMQGESGVWSYRKGGRVDARLIRKEGTNVILALSDGKTWSVAATNLSDADHAFLRAAGVAVGALPAPPVSAKPTAIPTAACRRCGGSGRVPCPAPGCTRGKVECSGPCLKLSQGPWVHLQVPGHDPGELWRKFPDANGRTYKAWNQHHLGEVVVMQNGEAVNLGPCKICGGSTEADCSVCKGRGTVPCTVCAGADRESPVK